MKKSNIAQLSVLLIFISTMLYPQNNATTENGLLIEPTALQTLPETPNKYYDFWIGEWNVSWDENGKIGKGTNIISPILDGTALQENFEITEGQSKGFKGTSISTYNKSSKTWKQVWIDSQGAYYNFIGAVEGDTPIFKTKAIEKDGKRLVSRMVFKDIAENSFIWDWESSIDGGNQWRLNWRIHYNRKKNETKSISSEYGIINPNTPKETLQFGQLVGIWQCTSWDMLKDSTWHESKAEWRFKYALDGYAIEDIWIEKKEDKTNNTIALGSDFHGKNIRIYNPKLNKWQCVWINNRNNSISPIWQAEYKDGQITMRNSSETSRIVFYDISDNSFQWKYESKVGSKWIITSKIMATRIENQNKS